MRNDLPCDCGHGRDYHPSVPFEGELADFCGHPCEFEGCDCMDYTPSGDDYDDD